MTIEVRREGGGVTLFADGWLDTASSPMLGMEIEKITAAESITLDFDKVEYMASAGLRQVISAHKYAKDLGAAFSVINVGTEVMNIFRVTGIDRKMDIREK